MTTAEFRATYLRDDYNEVIVPLVLAQTYKEFEYWYQGRGLRPTEFVYLRDAYQLDGLHDAHLYLLSRYRQTAIWQDEALRTQLLNSCVKFYYCSIRGAMKPWTPR